MGEGGKPEGGEVTAQIPIGADTEGRATNPTKKLAKNGAELPRPTPSLSLAKTPS